MCVGPRDDENLSVNPPRSIDEDTTFNHYISSDGRTYRSNIRFAPKQNMLAGYSYNMKGLFRWALGIVGSECQVSVFLVLVFQLQSFCHPPRNDDSAVQSTEFFSR